jgi:hypothetical protein
MAMFRNIFLNLGTTININFRNLAMTRRAKMIEEGYEVNCINWDLYVKVLEAKAEMHKRK